MYWRSSRYQAKTPVVIDHLDNGSTHPQLSARIAAADLKPRSALRITKPPAKELGLLDPCVHDDTQPAAMLEHPVQVNRPTVGSPKRVRLCRPTETELELLGRLPPGPIAKEDGTLKIDPEGKRVGFFTEP